VEILIAIVAGVLLAVVFVVISAPLRAARSAESAGAPAEDEQARQSAASSGYQRAELEAARETKYREIRDAELDLRTGKLSSEDYEAIDSGLRAEALELLDRLEALDAKRPGERADPAKAKPKLEG
jgi:flagellar biosynthesis/type III secretory pathway M-ring protein FliF/YscJ